MASLVNEVSWSRTRLSAFATCRRRYWYQYYRKWNGWESTAAEERRIAYRLSCMTSLVMLAGEAAHEAIKALLLSHRDGRPIDASAAEEIARDFMNAAWSKAKRRAFLGASPKWNRPLFELYYGDPPSKEATDRASEIARSSVRNLAESPFFAELAATDKRDWTWIDEKGPIDDSAAAVRVDGARVWAMPDFVRRVGDGGLIYDWKTGGPKPDDELQVLSYALHAKEAWGFKTASIRAVLVYLRDGVETREIAVTEDLLAATRRRIAEDVAAMKALHAADPPCEAFPLVEDRETCAECFFRELCPALQETPVHRRDTGVPR